jgi:hypothetical protein
MANEVTYASLGNLRTAAVLNQLVYKKINDQVDLRFTCMETDSPAGSGSAAVKVGQVDFDEVAAQQSEAPASVAPSALGSGAATVTVARQAVRYDPSDLFLMTGSAGSVGADDLAQGLADAVIRQYATIITTLYASATTTSGTTGTVLTVDDILDGQFNLIINDVDGDQWCTLKPKAFTQLQSSMTGVGGAFQFDSATNELMKMKSQGYKGSWNGINFITASTVTDDSTDFSGAIYSKGAIAYAEMDPSALANNGVIEMSEFLKVAVKGSSVWIEPQRDADRGLTELVGNGYFGASVNDQDRIVEILSAV